MRKIIVPIGYMGSGSSAVTDIISEFDNVNNEYGYFEYVFLHCPDGVFDLEDKLLIGNNALRSDEAIHSFLKTMKKLYNKKYWWVGNYKKRIGKEFYNITTKYIDELTDYKLAKYWYVQEETNLKMFFQLILKKIVSLITLNKVKLKKPLKYKEMYLSYPTKEKFYTLTSKYIYNVINLFDNSTKDIVFDQLLLPHNLFRIKKYFNNDLKAIVVSRDPRDVFISNKYIWSKMNETVAFSSDVKEFCQQYRQIREMENKIENENILRINFEDLIYNYDCTLEKIVNFLGFSNRKHIHKKEKFNPANSINNTQLFKNKEYEEEGKYIEKNLKEYIYDFSKVKEVKKNDKKPF